MQTALNTLHVGQAVQLKAEAASQWRGILQCKYCDSKDLKTELEDDRPHPALRCNTCGRFNKWLS